MAHGLRRGGSAALLTVVLGLTASGLVGPAGAEVPEQTGSRTSAGSAAPLDGRLVFADGDTGQIYTINPDGTALVQVTDTGPDEFAVDPRWSPDSSRIIFSSNPGGGDFRLFRMNADGSNVHQVTSEPLGYLDFDPSYTPNGKWVVYTRCRPDPPGGCALFSVRANGTDRRALTKYRHGIYQQADFEAEVSPRGGRIAFTRFEHNGIISQVWVMRTNGTHAHPVTAPRREGGYPRWTPDGHHLLITDNYGHVGENVWRMRPDGSSLTRLTSSHFPHNDALAAPSPSGQKIAFMSDRDYPDVIGFDLFVMNAGGGGQHAIQTGRIFDVDWGTAPLLSAKSGTPQRSLAPRRPSGSRPQVSQHALPWRAAQAPRHKHW